MYTNRGRGGEKDRGPRDPARTKKGPGKAETPSNHGAGERT